jgi:hypothetical protein
MIGQMVKKWQHFFKIQEGGAAILENTLPVELKI